MSFRILKSSGYVGSAAHVTSCTSRKVDAVTLDRYRTIRNFFTLQQKQGGLELTRVRASRLQTPRPFVACQLEHFHSTAFRLRKHSGTGKGSGSQFSKEKDEAVSSKQSESEDRQDSVDASGSRLFDSPSTRDGNPHSASRVVDLDPPSHHTVSSTSQSGSPTEHDTSLHAPSTRQTAGDPSPTASESNSPASSPLDPQGQKQTQPPSATPSLPYNFENYSRFFRRLALSLPHLHRPTRDDFLRVADGFWQRLRIRFKWFTIKSFRKFNADDISGIITWIVMSQTLWILVGTTTFFSVVFAIANSLRLQRFIARGISDYLTSETGITIIFESAIVPKWKDSRISFKNVYISRRPSSYTHRPKKNDGHMAAVGYDVGNHPAYHGVEEEDEDLPPPVEEDANYTMFDLNVDSIDVTLSLWRWLDGKGLIEDAVVKGVRGVLDRRSVSWDPENPLDPVTFRHLSHPGDFELESLQIEDLLITVYQPGGFRPYNASIFRADIRLFRKSWMFYDLLSAENIVGQFDNCLFSLHKPQSIGRTTEKDLEDGDWARMSRIRIDGVNIDHLQASTSMEGPVSWITSGKLDAVLDIKFPRDPEDALPFNAILEEIADAISTTLSTAPDPAHQRIPGQRELAKPALSPPEPIKTEEIAENLEPKVVIDIDLRFRDVKAAVPIFSNDLSYVNSALIRPIVAFMNANRTLVPIHCRVVKNLSDFEGSWTMWESGLTDEISLKIYDALAYHVGQANLNRRIKTVSYWSLQKTAGAVLQALRTLVDPVSQQFKETYLRSLDGDVLLFRLTEQELIEASDHEVLLET